MYTVCVRDHVMIAHSLKGAVFGPAQGLHGATYVIDVEFRRAQADADGIVIDIGAASAALKRQVDRLSYRNLDAEPEFNGRNTTTEFLAHWIFEQMRQAVLRGELGSGAASITSLRVILHESHVAWAAFEGSLGA